MPDQRSVYDIFDEVLGPPKKQPPGDLFKDSGFSLPKGELDPGHGMAPHEDYPPDDPAGLKAHLDRLSAAGVGPPEPTNLGAMNPELGFTPAMAAAHPALAKAFALAGPGIPAGMVLGATSPYWGPLVPPAARIAGKVGAAWAAEKLLEELVPESWQPHLIRALRHMTE
jgi:hypothetical protein